MMTEIPGADEEMRGETDRAGRGTDEDGDRLGRA
jgi:hypothetical protein